jgi:amino acid adenylation domain-containing protein
VVLEQMVAEPEQRIGDVSLLKGAEREQVLVEWNRTEAEYPQRCAHELFEEQAKKRPEAVAVEYEDQSWSYRELNERANQLARHLGEMGVGPEVLVGLCVERSLEMVVGILGILKAGGAYVPLDPEYPVERLAFMLEDSGIAVLLSQSHLLNGLPAGWVQILCLDSQWEQIAEQNTGNLEISLEAGNAAYVIYTSGSSGWPKGVLNTHGGLSNLAAQQRRLFGVSPESGVMQFASLSFDAATSEWAMALTSGARLVLVKREKLLDPEELVRVMEQREIEVVTLPPSVLGMLPEVELRKLNTLVVAGEACWAELVSKWGEGRRMLNAYGPSEATVCATVSEPLGKTRKPDIGKPIGNAVVYVLDENLQAVPVGVGGELYIGGQGVARGYRNRPGLTAEKFVPHAFGKVGGERMYRTGDRARWRSDGTLEFLGRLDDQVKVRGYRIELGEIEAALLECAGVEQVLVIVRGEGAKRQLVAYVVVRSAAGKDKAEGALRTGSAELSEQLRRRLPEYMVPSAFVLLKALPLTPNGKVDRKALPEPEHYGRDGEDAGTPRSAEEEILCGIFAAVLKQEHVGIEQNFFELGGHSLLAMQVIVRIRSAFDVELPLRALFEAPTVGELAERVQGTERVTAPPIVCVPREGDLPLSFAQQRLWFLHQLEPESVAYNIPSGVRLRGELSREGVCWSLHEMVRRHETLRTSFTVRDGGPVQVIAAEQELKIEEIDLRDAMESEREGEAARYAQAEAHAGFDLEQGPLVRVKLLRLAEQEHVLLVTMHHIVSDGWSSGIMVREFNELYQAYTRGEESPLPQLKVQYADYAAWQREWLRDEVLEREMEYWRRQLAELEPLELPTDHARPAVTNHQGAAKSFAIEKHLSEKLKELSRREGVTLFMSLLAAFQVVLSKYAGQLDVAVGTDIANRNRLEIEGLIGFFVNQLVLRTGLSGNPDFREVLGRVRRVTLDAYQHQDVPFEKLVEELQPERDLSRSPLFQVKLVLQNNEQQELQLPGLRVSNFPIRADLAKVDLQLTLGEGSEGLVGELRYVHDLYEAETVVRMVDHWRVVLEQMVAEPEQRIGDVSLLKGAEREQVLVEWNRTEAEYPQRCVHELFEEQAEKRPEAVAVEYEDQSWSYRELNERANQLARHLREMGVGPEMLVGLCVERSLEMVVGILGILKAGGAYVPLDPEYPVERLAFMLEDSGIAVLLSQSHLLNGLPVGWTQILCLDSQWEQIAEQNTGNLEISLEAGNAAYVVYTSGSSGWPKGVLNTHGGLSNLAAQQRLFGLSPESGVLQFASLSFDAATWEWTMALTSGARLVLVKRERLLDPEELVRVMEEREIEVVALPPSVLGSLPEAELRNLRTIVVAGEACWAELVSKWGEGRRMLNSYGPSEATVCTTLSEPLTRTGKPDIGKPMGNIKVYVLDENLQAVPVGVGGELYIGGQNVARGYRNRAELTAEKFVPHVFGKAGGERMYSTGDRARWRSDGTLDFIGRLDDQVKVRGYRIELGEVEAALLECAGVEQALVIARGQGAKRQLVAYVARRNAAGKDKAEGEIEASTAELGKQLRGRLPGYMVPSVIVQLEALPLTPNGKVDRKALPEPQGNTYARRGYEAPRGEVESAIAAIWSEELKVDRVGRHDNFFELGGHSLLAVRVIERMRQSGLRVDGVQALFVAKSLADLANSAEELTEIIL